MPIDPLIHTGGKTRKKHFKAPGPKVCHPRLQGKNIDCLSPELLKEIGQSHGAPSELEGIQLRDWLVKKTRCKTERCWLEKAPLDSGKKKEIQAKYFRPSMPDDWVKDPDQWLDSNNIADVMKQYEESVPHFKFYGTNPIDFSAPDPYTPGSLEKNKCLQDEICKMNLKELQAKGKTKLGFVYNLDPSNKGGSHWIASFTDIPAHKTYYFDSYGMKPPKQIARFMRSMTLQDPLMKLHYNARRFQFGETECGMYCLYFIIRMLFGDNFKDFCKNALKDNEMLELRKWLFSPKNE
jgi:hypothetical protein